MTLAKRIAAKRAEQQRGFSDVEEWGEADNPLRLYFTQISARDIEKVQRKYSNFLAEPSMSAMVEMIIVKCEDESGENDSDEDEEQDDDSDATEEIPDPARVGAAGDKSEDDEGDIL